MAIIKEPDRKQRQNYELHFSYSTEFIEKELFYALV